MYPSEELSQVAVVGGVILKKKLKSNQSITKNKKKIAYYKEHDKSNVVIEAIFYVEEVKLMEYG